MEMTAMSAKRNEMVRKAALLLATVCAGAIGVHAEYAYPIYTVTTSGEGTNELASAQVEVVAEAGVDPETVDFSTLSGTFANGTIFKRGTGFLMSCDGISTFTGTLVVVEGAWIATKRGQLGQSVDANTPKSSVVISNGATVVVAAPAGSRSDTMYLRQPITMSGTGYKGLGAICVMNETAQTACFRNTTWKLLGDTTITFNRFKTPSTNYLTINLNGYTLTLSSLDGSAGSNSFDFKYSTISNPGHIVLENAVRLSLTSDARQRNGATPSARTVLNGSAANTITYRPRGSNMYECWMQLPNFDAANWSLVFENNGVLRATHGLWDDTSYAGWNGPIEVQAGKVSASGVAGCSIALKGAITGNGGIESTRGQQLHLMNDGNTFKGPLTLNQNREGEGELCVYGENSFPYEGAGGTLTDSSLALMRLTGTYTLPSLTFNVGEGKTESFRGGTNGFARSVTKTGAGTLDISAPVAITGVTTVAGGILRIPYKYAGLIAGGIAALPSADPAPTSDYPYTKISLINSYMITNRVALGTDIAYTQENDHWLRDQATWSGRAFFNYHGYVWNRSDEPKDWSFALAITQGADLYLGGKEVPGMYATDYRAEGFVKFKTVTLQPGATRFDLRIYTTGAYGPSYNWSEYWKGYTYKKNSNSGEPLAWKPNFGFGINMNGEESTNVVDYIEAMDAGDGALFTVSADGLDDGVAAKLPQFSHLKLSGGTFDYRGNDFSVPVLEGVNGAITNSNAYFPGGSLTVAEKWLIKGTDSALGAKALEVGGRLRFAPGAVLEWEDLPLLPRGEYVLARSATGFDSLPEWRPANRNHSRWHLAKAKDADGNDILTFTWCAGTTVIIR